MINIYYDKTILLNSALQLLTMHLIENILDTCDSYKLPKYKYCMLNYDKNKIFKQ